ncbi:Nitrogen permease regulator-like 3, variant 2 [Balamuthia mandrillaris]
MYNSPERGSSSSTSSPSSSSSSPPRSSSEDRGSSGGGGGGGEDEQKGFLGIIFVCHSDNRGAQLVFRYPEVTRAHVTTETLRAFDARLHAPPELSSHHHPPPRRTAAPVTRSQTQPALSRSGGGGGVSTSSSFLDGGGGGGSEIGSLVASNHVVNAAVAVGTITSGGGSASSSSSSSVASNDGSSFSSASAFAASVSSAASSSYTTLPLANGGGGSVSLRDSLQPQQPVAVNSQRWREGPYNMPSAVIAPLLTPKRVISLSSSSSSSSSRVKQTKSNHSYNDNKNSKEAPPQQAACSEGFDLAIDGTLFLGYPVWLEEKKKKYHHSSSSSQSAKQQHHQQQQRWKAKVKEEQRRENFIKARKLTKSGNIEGIPDSLNQFNLVFVITAEEARKDGGRCYAMYKRVVRQFVTALRHEQQRCGYLTNEVQAMLNVRERWLFRQVNCKKGEKPPDHQQLTDDILNASPLAHEFREIYHGLVENRQVQVSVNRWIDIHLSLFDTSTSIPNNNSLISSASSCGSTNSYSPRLYPLRPYHTLLLLESRQSILRALPQDSSSTIQLFLDALFPFRSGGSGSGGSGSSNVDGKERGSGGGPSAAVAGNYYSSISFTKSFLEISIETNIPLNQIFLMAAHFVYWRKGKIIKALTPHSVFIIHPKTELQMAPRDQSFQFSFPSFRLAEVLAKFSQPKPLIAHVQAYSTPKQKDFIPVVMWLLRQGLLMEVNTYYYLNVPKEVEEKYLRNRAMMMQKWNRVKKGEEDETQEQRMLLGSKRKSGRRRKRVSSLLSASLSPSDQSSLKSNTSENNHETDGDEENEEAEQEGSESDADEANDDYDDEEDQGSENGEDDRSDDEEEDDSFVSPPYRTSPQHLPLTPLPLTKYELKYLQRFNDNSAAFNMFLRFVCFITFFVRFLRSLTLDITKVMPVL